jgi:hypothetical protein
VGEARYRNIPLIPVPSVDLHSHSGRDTCSRLVQAFCFNMLRTYDAHT